MFYFRAKRKEVKREAKRYDLVVKH